MNSSTRSPWNAVTALVAKKHTKSACDEKTSAVIAPCYDHFIYLQSNFPTNTNTCKMTQNADHVAILRWRARNSRNSFCSNATRSAFCPCRRVSSACFVHAETRRAVFFLGRRACFGLGFAAIRDWPRSDVVLYSETATALSSVRTACVLATQPNDDKNGTRVTPLRRVVCLVRAMCIFYRCVATRPWNNGQKILITQRFVFVL